MWRTKFGQLLLFSAGILGFSASSWTQAQVVPDRTLNYESSFVTNDVMVKEAKASLIEGGAIRDRNLFHSFIELSINDGDRVYFANPEGVTNIIRGKIELFATTANSHFFNNFSNCDQNLE